MSTTYRSIPSLYSFTYEQLLELMHRLDQPRFRADQIWQGLYKNFWTEFNDFTTLPHSLINVLNNQYSVKTIHPFQTIHSSDRQTTKTLFSLPDGKYIEAVLMRYHKRRTLCISTQVGCAMGCVFCATGKMGLLRNLTSGEIIEQVIYYAHFLREAGEQVTNIVIMGMGEPFHNYENVIQALNTLENPKGMGLSSRRFTISTVGLVPLINRFKEENRRENLAVSLHTVEQNRRESLIPVARKYPLSELKHACLDYVQKSRRRLTFEWALIQGENDSETEARMLATWLKSFVFDGSALCHVNLIPVNPTPGFKGAASSIWQAKRFKQILESQHIPCTIRTRRGIDIQAGCGQLAILKNVSSNVE